MPMPGAVFHVAPPVNRPGQMAPFAARNLSMSVPPVQLMSPSMLPVWNAVKLFVVTTKRVNVPVRIGGATWNTAPGIGIPGYLFRHDGKIDLQCPVSAKPSTWGLVKQLYR